MFNSTERRLLRKLDTPWKIQEYIERNLEYNFEENGETTRSFRRVVRDRKAHCLEGTLFAATVLQYYGHPPLMVCIEARDMDHNLAVYRTNKGWGSVSQSRDKNLKGRAPKHRTIKKLLMSYFPYYWNYYSKDKDKTTDLTMRGYALIDLSNIDRDWITTEEDLGFVEDILWEAKYRFLFPRKDKSKFYRVDRNTSEIIFL